MLCHFQSSMGAAFILLTAPLRLLRSGSNRLKDSACCAPRDPGDAPSVSPAPHTHAPSTPPSDAAPQLPRPRPRPTLSPWRRLGRDTPTALTRGNRPSPGSGARSPLSLVCTLITRRPGLDTIHHPLILLPECISEASYFSVSCCQHSSLVHHHLSPR